MTRNKLKLTDEQIPENEVEGI